MGVDVSPIEFTCEKTIVRGRLFTPAGSSTARPAVVMFHGFSATATGMVADRYAQIFAEAGVTALLADHRGLGRSDGEPRGEINPWRHARDYRAAITCLEQHPAVDPRHLAVWGDSLSGHVALVDAAVDERVSAVVVQVPGCGDERSPDDPSGHRFNAISDTVLTGDLESLDRTIIGPLPVVSLDQANQHSLLTSHTAYRWFLHYGADYDTGWENLATVAQLDAPEPFDSQLCMPHIGVPLLMVVAEHDEMHGANADVARHAYELATCPKELVTVGGGHFGLLYHDRAEFEHASRAQRDFLVRHLSDAVPTRSGERERLRLNRVTQ